MLYSGGIETACGMFKRVFGSISISPNILGYIFILLTLNHHLTAPVNAADVIVKVNNIVDEKIYVNLGKHHQCFRVLNGTHQLGCTTKSGGSVGVLHRLAGGSDADLAWVLEDKGRASPYMILLDVSDTQVYTPRVLEKLRGASDHVAGLLVYKSDNSSASPYSDDSTCPNENFNLYAASGEHSKSSCATKPAAEQWNQAGSQADGFWFHDWPFPVALLENQTQIELANRCYDEFNQPHPATPDKPRSWPLCAVDLDFFMVGARSTATCMRRNNLFQRMDARYTDQNCLPMSGDSIYGFVPPAPRKDQDGGGGGAGGFKNDSVLVIATRMDSLTAFNALSPGRDSAMSGMVAVLGAMAGLRDRYPSFKVVEDRRVLFVLFNGEALGYAGSSRMLFDMNNDVFPGELQDSVANQSALFQISHIAGWLEVEQVGYPSAADAGPKYFIHTDPVQGKSQEVEKAVKKMTETLKDFIPGASQAKSSSGLPTASAHTFLRQRLNIPTLVLAGHDSPNFLNPFYNGPFDRLQVSSDQHALIKKGIISVSQALAKYAERFLTNSDGTSSMTSNHPPDFPPDVVTKIEEMVDCFMFLPPSNCSLFRIIAEGWDRPRLTSYYFNKVHQAMAEFPTYMGPSGSIHWPSVFALNITEDLLADARVPMNRTDRDTCGPDLFPPDGTPAAGDTSGGSVDGPGIYMYHWTPDIWSTTGDDSSDSQAGDSSSATFDLGSCIRTPAAAWLAESPAFDDVTDGATDFASIRTYATWTESTWADEPKAKIFLKASTGWEGLVFGVGFTVAILSLFIVWFLEGNSHLLFANTQLDSV